MGTDAHTLTMSLAWFIRALTQYVIHAHLTCTVSYSDTDVHARAQSICSIAAPRWHPHAGDRETNRRGRC
jgi:hypothetical protein